MNFNIILVGLLISIIFYELTDITPGGIIVPGLMVMYIKEPERMIYTVVIAIATYFIVKFISRYFLIFGKRRFVLMILISLGLSFIAQLIFKLTSFSFLEISLIGYTLSGIIANNIHKQGLKRTIPALVIVVAVIELLVIITNGFNF